ncbi:MAG TPA: hypothetical protein IAB65_05940 [Candidatus Onthocola stercorigallinarum]|nr:hypothetical protein [Candidatus Onthocola stercorigallinarum]
MKKFLIIVIILLVISGGIGGYFYIKDAKEKARIAEIKEGWYVEVLEDDVNIRAKGSANGTILGKTKKGDIYAVNDVDVAGNTYWYEIDYDGTPAFIFSSTKYNYLKDVNNPNDIATPTIKFFDKIYYVDSIDDINYDHLEVWDDRPGAEVTHQVYHETGVDINGNIIDQYWIQYTVTDKEGKSSSKVQKIEFNKRPSEDRVLDFKDLER